MFLLLSFCCMAGCNLCPVVPNGDGDNPENGIFATIIPLNSSIPIISFIDTDSYSIKSLKENAVMYSPPAINGNYAFLQVGEQGSNNELYLGNIENNSNLFLEKEGQDFLIVNPTISRNGDKIVFLGGNGQLFLWVYEQSSNSFYIDKISSKSANSIIPAFSSDGSTLAFAETENPNEVKIKVINTYNTENIIYQHTFSAETDQSALDNYLSISEENVIAFCTRKDTLDLIYLIDVSTGKSKEFELPRDLIGIKIAKLSPDGRHLAVSAEDNNIWILSVAAEEVLFSRATNAGNCNSYLHLDWNKDGTKLLTQSYNCNDDLLYGSSLFVLELTEENNLLTTKSMKLLCNNVQRAFWSN